VHSDRPILDVPTFPASERLGSTESARARSNSGASFDGRYVYLSPGGFGPVLRFDARDAAPVPKGYEGGSFY
jgi:hypothetical protein